MKLIKVLWVDDEDFKEIENQAYDKGIDITHVQSWIEAEPLLQGFRFDDWSAIILDCYCCMYPKGPEDHKFLQKALERLSQFRNGRILPWYILSRGTDDDFFSIIDNQLSEERNLWDSDWEKVYYSKIPEDYSVLFDRILKMSEHLPNYKVRYRFKDVFDLIGIEELFSKQVEDIMFPVLKSLLCPEEKNNFTPILFYNQLRQAIECFFRSCNNLGLLPDALVKTKTGVNLSLSSHYLSGHNAEMSDGLSYRYGNKGESVFPASISKVIRDILKLANIESHTVDLTDKEKKQVEEYLSDTVTGQYVIYSMAMGLCSVFVWYKSYLLDGHLDPRKNIEKCVCFQKQNKDVQVEYEGTVETDEDGNIHCGCYLIQPKLSNLMGKTIKVIKSDNNKNELTNQRYSRIVVKYKV